MPPDPSLSDDVDFTPQLRTRMLRYRRRRRGYVYVSPEMESVPPADAEGILRCCPDQLDRYLCARHAAPLARQAVYGLRELAPECSARMPAPMWVLSLGALALLACVTSFAVWGWAGLYMICLGFLPYCLASCLVRFSLLFGKGNVGAFAAPVDTANELPLVSILVPLYREAGSLPALVQSLSRLSYPARRLEVFLLLEEDDTETLGELKRCELPQHFRVLHVPAGEPRTKPKAMNFALPFVRGEVLGIFDAEDCPEPDQVSKAVARLRGDPGLGCVQARLNYYNHDETLLTRCAAIEYALWFDLILTRLSRRGLPVPLGGTSVYLRTAILREIGAWDPDNVTEDADLGLRLSRRGWNTALFDSTTHEEATTGVAIWLRQRTRWIKGYMITWAVHMRRPLRLWRELGGAGFVAANILLLDGFLGYLAQPVFLGALVLGMLGVAPPPVLSGGLGASVFAVFFAGQIFVIGLAAAAAWRRFGWRRAVLAPMLWLYWASAAIAALRALWQALTAPRLWEKTEHCLSVAALQRRALAVHSSEGRVTRQAQQALPKDTA